MDSSRSFRTAVLALLVLLSACRHPLAIEGEGDIVDLNGGQYGCSLEQFEAGSSACAANEIEGEYLVNYTAIPRPGWEFVGWDGYCAEASTPPNCQIEFSTDVISLIKPLFPDTALPQTTARFQPVGGVGNAAPTALPASFTIDAAVPYFQSVLAGYDPDGDLLNFHFQELGELNGRVDVALNEATGAFSVVVADSSLPSFSLYFQVTDGQYFSDVAEVEFSVTTAADDRETGRLETDSTDYSSFELADYDPTITPDLGQGESLPSSIDLSNRFPYPGNQGRQSSCVGWAVGYALKSYQEQLENGWTFNNDAHLFSPAFIYNQINYGQDNGSYIWDALSLVVNKGAASLETAPYIQNDYYSQPTPNAFQEAARFKAARWARVSNLQQIKAALAHRNPVVVGIDVYAELSYLYGPNSVYRPNVFSGRLGGHAVTLVGYDDNRYDGAFKVINSWGTSWGDQGYFWLPYDTLRSNVLRESYVLIDQESDTGDQQDDGLVVVTPTRQPNLQVSSWEAEWDMSASGGSGVLYWEVDNTGVGDAPAGVNVTLALYTSASAFNPLVVVSDDIPFAMESGGGANRTRDAANGFYFTFPGNIREGYYYMAVSVDDIDEVRESNEQDNISWDYVTKYFYANSPDLTVREWGADWDGFGNGTLRYTVVNDGASATNSAIFDVTLALSSSQYFSSYFPIFRENVTFNLAPGGTVFRDFSNPARFDLDTGIGGGYIPNGVYYMSVWADSLGSVAESNESNNYSVGSNLVTISSSPAQHSGEKSDASGFSTGNGLRNSVLGEVKMVKVEVDEKGRRRFYEVSPGKEIPGLGVISKLARQSAGASNPAVFPAARRSMPKQ